MKPSKKALIVTHPQEMFDWSRSILNNLESFVSEHQDYDLIRLISPENDSYFSKGLTIRSNYGRISEPYASNIVANYDKVITAGGYFQHCALKTFNSLASAYFNNPNGPFSVIVPLDLFYGIYSDSKGMDKTTTYDKIKDQRIKIKNLEMYFRKRLNQFAIRARFSGMMNGSEIPKITEKLSKDKVMAECLEMSVCGVVSYRDIPDL